MVKGCGYRDEYLLNIEIVNEDLWNTYEHGDPFDRQTDKISRSGRF